MRRMVLKAFVCESGNVTWCNDVGASTFTDIYVRRPDACRYAIMQLDAEYVMADLYEANIHPDFLQGTPMPEPFSLGPHHVFPTLEAAVIAATLSQ